MKNLVTELSSKTLRKKSGVYLIRCNSHTYIGSSKNLYDRLREHRYRLIKGTHNNDFLSKCCKKYGIESFEFEILEFTSPETRVEREGFYIKTLKPDMNLELDPKTGTLSTYSRQKLSKSIKEGRKNGKYELSIRRGPVHMYNRFGEHLYTFETKEIASKELNIPEEEIITAAGGYARGKLYRGFRFRYALSQVKERKFNQDGRINMYYDYFMVTENGRKKIRVGIKNVNEFLLKQIRDKNFSFTIEILPKDIDLEILDKVTKLSELLEPLEGGDATTDLETEDVNAKKSSL